MTLLDQLANNSGETLVISKDANGDFMVAFDKCSVYTNPGALGVCGRGRTTELAARNYIQQITGKTLVFNYGTDSERKAKFIFIIPEQEKTCDFEGEF